MDLNVLKKAIQKYLHEDIGSGDLTSEATIGPDQIGIAEFVAKGSFIVCGIEAIAPLVFTTQNSIIEIVKTAKDKTDTESVGNRGFSYSVSWGCSRGNLEFLFGICFFS